MGGFKCSLWSCWNSQESLRKSHHQLQELPERLLWLSTCISDCNYLPVSWVCFSGLNLGLSLWIAFQQWDMNNLTLCNIQAGTLNGLAWGCLFSCSCPSLQKQYVSGRGYSISREPQKKTWNIAKSGKLAWADQRCSWYPDPWIRYKGPL